MLKVGVIGVGSISEFHIKPYLESEQVELVALCDSNQNRLNEKGKLYGVTQLYSDYQQLLQNDEINAVSICTWNNTHAIIAIAALEAGKHVLVEKPLSMTTEEALAIEAAVKKSGKVLQVGFVRRHGDNVKLLKTFIDNNQLGEIYYAKASCLRRLGNPGGWFSDSSKSGGGPLIDLGVHMIDICWYMMGKPRPISVSGNTYSKLGNRSNIQNLSFYKAADYDPTLNDVEDLTNALIRFENGASLFVDVSFTLQAQKDELNVKLYGDKGGAEIEPELALVTEKNNTILNVTPQVDTLTFDVHKAFVNEINHFVSCCKDGKETIAPVADGVQVMKMLNAVYESAKSGKETYL
ncbi:gfo/Idh/MocA family oxidoreductase [Gracilibacillus salitolerans]|uniref:Gfo/Idh/MocA family oxidoreductase n=1 Tax=Gracilibacillus salitolerans TaxID=2663022 RepID=A0A5Q2THF1_9BACI|nr:Gfo/Idh/MocA family oxidoreductase [Gracilibacillus salitolerans]QGH33472.1 gfo/Idh/MocA family oxidoreductase [Gracilibacillus salitolerans]